MPDGGAELLATYTVTNSPSVGTNLNLLNILTGETRSAAIQAGSSLPEIAAELQNSLSKIGISSDRDEDKVTAKGKVNGRVLSYRIQYQHTSGMNIEGPSGVVGPKPNILKINVGPGPIGAYIVVKSSNDDTQLVTVGLDGYPIDKRSDVRTIGDTLQFLDTACRNAGISGHYNASTYYIYPSDQDKLISIRLEGIEGEVVDPTVPIHTDPNQRHENDPWYVHILVQYGNEQLGGECRACQSPPTLTPGQEAYSRWTIPMWGGPFRSKHDAYEAAVNHVLGSGSVDKDGNPIWPCLSVSRDC